MKKPRCTLSILALILAVACLFGVLIGCGPSKKDEDRDIEVIVGTFDDLNKGKKGKSTDTGSTAGADTEKAEDDPVVNGKWVLKSTKFDQIGESSVNAELDETRTISAELYCHSFSFSYNPKERVDELDVPYTENYRCVCTEPPKEIKPGENFFIDIEAISESCTATVHGMCCRLYLDKSSSLDIRMESAQEYDYSDFNIYPVWVGTSPGPGYGIDIGAPAQDYGLDTLTFYMPKVTESTEKFASSFTIQFASSYGNSYFKYEWVRD